MNKIIFTSVIIILCIMICHRILAQPPTIVSFTPAKGPIGTEVTIAGTNFDLIPANNTVFFGATQATVTAATATELTVSVPGGATFQPITVLTNGLLAYSLSSFVVTFEGGGITTNSFDTKVDFVPGSNPFSVAVGDFDNDGKSDLVVTNFNSNTVSVFRNNSPGSGTISYATKVDFATGTNPISVSIGDLDGDGKIDLAVANSNSSSNSISILRNTSSGTGNISFANKVDFTTGSDPLSVSIGDLDGDGKADFAVANWNSNTVSVFRNTSSGIGNISYATKVDFTTGVNPRSVANGDLDGDGKADLVVANRTSNTVSVFRNTSVPGTISFAPKMDHITGSSPHAVAIGDSDDDNQADLVVANWNDNSVSIFRNTSPGAGTISFTAKDDYTTATNPTSISLGDLNGDGMIDIAVANATSNTISLLRNTSASPGTISYAVKVDYTTGTEPRSVAIGDLDNDGKADFAVVNISSNTVSVFRNIIAPPSDPPSVTSFTPTNGPIGTSVTITGTNFEPTLENNIVFFGATQALVTAATTITLTVTVPAGATYQPITILTNGLTAYSPAPFIVSFSGGAGIDATTFDSKVDFSTGIGSSPNSITIGDLDGDGKLDLAVAISGSDKVSIYRNISSSPGVISYATKIDFTTGDAPRSIAIGDLDGDGKADLAVANWNSNTVSVFRNTSTGAGIISFATKLDFPSGQWPSSVSIGDLDGDGKIDLAVVNGNSNSVSVFRNTSTSPGIISYDAKVDFPTGIGPSSLSLGDFDGDGNTDLAITGYNNGSFVSVLRNISTGPGDINYDVKVDYFTGLRPESVTIGDLDGDDKPELVLVNVDSNTASVFLNTSPAAGTISFASRVDYTTGSLPWSVSLGDIDGDAKVDMVVTNYSSSSLSVSVLRNMSPSPGNISFAAKVDFATGYDPNSVSIGDFDGDGKADMAVANGSDYSVSVFRNAIISPSTETDILTFTLLEQTTPATISAISHTVNIEVISDTDLTSLIPTFTLSTGASAMVSVVEQVSGTSANDFTLPVTYTITAEDGITSENWVVTVTTANCTPLPSANIIGGGAVCSGNPAPDIVWTLTGTQPFSFTITGPGGGFPLNEVDYMSNTYAIVGPTLVGNYEMTDLQDNNSCNATALGGAATVTIIATAPPTIDAFTPGTDVCDDGAATVAPTLTLDLAPNSVQSYDITFDIYNSVPSFIGNQTLSKVTDAAGITSIDLDYVADLGQNPDTYEIEIKAIVNTGTGCSAAGLPASQFITINPCPPNGTDFLTFSLPEQTGLATINTVNHTLNIEVAYGTFVTSLIPTFTLSTGSSATASAIAQISGITANDFTNPVTYIITAQDGVTTQPWEVSVTIQEDLANPEISAFALPTIIQSGSGGEQASVTVTDNAGLSSVTFYSKQSNSSTFSSQEVTSSNDTYVVNITEGMVTDVGLEYFFLAEDTNVNDASTDTVQIVIQYNAENGPTIPNLSAGGAAKNWRMFSIPFVLDDKKVSTHFEVPLGTYDDTKWRIVHYKNDTERFVEYKNGLSIVERGKGYWFNSVQPATIPMSPGKGPSNTKDNLATLTLVAGWNQVGNPYAFDVSWSDVLSHNGITNEVESNLRVFENGTSLTNSTVLKAFGGAYLKANQAIPLEIPMVANSGGRLADINDFDKGWLLSLNLEAGIFINTVSGLGMHPEALLGNDRFDQIRIPRFAKHIDATFDHPEYFMPNFSRDIVPEQENYTWEFTISTNIDNEVRVISWNTLELTGGQKLVLIDQVNGNVIDMQVNTRYSYSMSKTRKFKVVYGDEAYLLEQFEGNNVYLGNNYPNPFTKRTIIPFSVHGKGSTYNVQMNIYSINGTLVKSLVNKTMPSGIYTVEWNGEANGGNSLSGLFIYSLEVQTSQGVQSFRKKMIVR